MKKIFIFVVIAISLYSCNSIRYIPVESIKTEYRNIAIKDSVFLYDSIFIKEKGDTLILERYRYLYRDKIVRDSIFVNDTIRVPYPVEVNREVKSTVSSWQYFQIWCGRVALIIALLVMIYFMLKLKKKLPF